MCTTTNASYFYTLCSDPRGEIEYSQGQNTPNAVLYVTLLEWMPGGKWTTERVNLLSLDNVTIDFTNEKKIETIERSIGDCKNGSPLMYFLKTEISTKKVTVSNKDGTSFAKNIDGFFREGKSLSVYLICEKHLEGESFCVPQVVK